MTWGATKGERFRAVSRNLVRRAVLVVENAIHTGQLRRVKVGREVEDDKATCGGGNCLQRGFVGEREGSRLTGRAFEKYGYNCLVKAPQITSRAGRVGDRDALVMKGRFSGREQIGEVNVVKPREGKPIRIYGGNRDKVI